MNNDIDELLAYISAITFKCSDGVSDRLCAISCFFIEINSNWLLCTAAHAIEDINELISKGNKLRNWNIDDSVAQEGKKKIAYPCDITQREQWICRNDKIGADFALILLDTLTVTNLVHNGMKAITYADVADENQLWPPKRLYVIGVPTSTITPLKNGVQKSYLAIPATQIERPSAWEDEKSEDALFAKLDDTLLTPDSQINIAGMSGGPVFGLFQDCKGFLKWKLVGIQSSWMASLRVIAIAPMAPLMQVFEEEIEKNQSKNNT